jgi:alpha,alpha-trehalose phosphorylase
MRDHDGQLSFAPRLPEDLRRLAFRLCFRGRRLSVQVEQTQATYAIVSGEPLELVHHGRPLTVVAGEPVTVDVPPAPARDRPRQPRGRAPAERHGVPSASTD